jgi:polyhydroxyalkanoate synthesis regulator phasin
MKKYLPYVLPVMILGGVLVIGTIVMAQTTDSNYPSIIQKLAERFNLNPEDVKSVFDQNREEIQAKAEQNFQDVLDQMVQDQKITQDQETAILEERAKIRDLKDQLKDLTPEERQAQMQNLRDEIQQWSEENSLNPGLIMGMGRGFGHYVGMMGWGMGDCPFHQE